MDFVIDLLFQLVLGVEHMHTCGVLHGDLRLDNALVFSRRPLVVKWSNFGSAVPFKRKHNRGEQSNSRDVVVCVAVCVVVLLPWLFVWLFVWLLLLMWLFVWLFRGLDPS